MLIACEECHRQYDVRHLEEGRRIRCECSRILTIHEPVAHTPRPLRCGNCGGPLAAEACRCQFCASEITFEEKNLDAVCPVCFARLPHDAHYCLECGIQIEPQILTAIPEKALCPRCTGHLRNRAVKTLHIVECSSCAGVWISPEVLERLLEEHDTQELALREMRRSNPMPLKPEVKVHYLPCITCGDRMVQRNYLSSGVMVDLCKEHGVWLDHDELPQILRFVRDGGLERGRQRDLEERPRERTRWTTPPWSRTEHSSMVSGAEDAGKLGAEIPGLFADFWSLIKRGFNHRLR